MKYFYRFVLIFVTSLILSGCGGGGGKAACSIAVGSLACGGVNSNSGSGGSPGLTTTYSVLHSMSNIEGASPDASLIQVNGVFYGTTQTGGAQSLGTVFSMNTAGQVTTLHSFVGGATDGAIPFAALVAGSDGNLYGTTTNGGSTGNGTVFKITLSSGVATYNGVVYSFVGGLTDGANPYGGLVQGSDNAFYGTTTYGGTYNLGTVFRITLVGGVVAEAPIHIFSGTVNNDGSNPQSGLIKDSAGLLYGTTSAGGTANAGTVFSTSTSGSSFTTLHQFDTTLGSVPYSPLLLGSNGNLYGTTSAGGSNNLGVVFTLPTTVGGTYTVLHQFTGSTSDGSTPYGNLVSINNIIYGTTWFGGAKNTGTLFSVTPTGVTNVVYSFGSSADGANPYSGLTLGADGYYYGTTSSGGSNSVGTVFKFYP